MSLVYRLTGVGRPIDPKYPTNLAILVVMGVAAVGAAALALAYGQDLGRAALAGGHAGLLVFVAWALCREIAPDDQPAAFIAVSVVIALWGFGHRPELLGGFALVTAVRVASRSTGVVPTLADSIGLVLLAAYAVWYGDWPVGLAVAIGLLANSALRPRDWRTIPFAATLIGIVAVTWSRRPPALDLHLGTWDWVVAGVVVAFALMTLGQEPPRSKQDVGGAMLSKPRVQAGMAVVAIAAAGSLLRTDVDGPATAAMWAAMLGAVLGRPLHLWRWSRKIRDSRLKDSQACDERRASDR